MSKLKVVGKDKGINEGKRELVIHWCDPEGEYKLDTYEDGYEIDKAPEGEVTLVTRSTLPDGKIQTTTTTYGYGEIRKMVETSTI